MLRNLSLSVLRYERVKTTEAKAKEVRVFVDRMVNLGKDAERPAEGAKAAAAATEDKPKRRRLSLPRRGGDKKDEAKAEAGAKPAPRRRTATKTATTPKKKTAKGATT